MAELADAADSKSADLHWSWGFNSPSRHHLNLRNQRCYRKWHHRFCSGVDLPHFLCTEAITEA